MRRSTIIRNPSETADRSNQPREPEASSTTISSSSSATATTMSSSTSADHTYNSEKHGAVVVGGFKQLWEDKSMCDTDLLVEDSTFPVHRCFLAACSRYFATMFKEGFTESSKRDVELKGVSARGLKAVLNFAYTGAVMINESNLQDVLEAASHLQFEEVLTFCSRYLKQQLTIDNCLHFLKMAEMYGMFDCKEDTKEFILENFIPVAESDDFRDVSLELLCEFLSSDKLRAMSELDVFKVATSWLENYTKGKDVAKQVLSLIRFGLMKSEDMAKVYQEPLMLSEACREVFQAALNYHLNLFSQPLITSPIAKMRAYKECLAVLGAGYLDNTLSPDVMTAVIDQGRLEQFEILFRVKDRRYFAAVALVNDFVYVVGGQTAMAGDGSHATNSAFRYNPRDNKWLQISSMSVPRTHFALIALPTCLVAVGGKNNRIALSTAECYDFVTNEWTMISSLPNTLFSHAGCCHNNKVYVSGGCPGEDFTDDVHCYDLRLEGWELQSAMNQSRGYHVMVTHGDKIFACAGNTNAGDRRDVLNTECYDVIADQWSILTPSLHGQSEAPAVKCAGKIFILGGYSWDAHSFQDTVQCYDMDTDSWELLDVKLPEPMTGLVACYMKLPLKMFDRMPHRQYVAAGQDG